MLCLLFIAFAEAGCDSHVSTNPNDYAGEYIFNPSDLALGEFASFVILRQDLSALEVRYSKTTKAITTTQESWYLSRGTGEELRLESEYQIDKSGSSISLNINYVSQYYKKIR
jgi:hypothetical protein